MNESDKSYVTDFNQPETLVTLGRLEFWSTKKSGTDVVLVMPDRRIENKGTLWIKTEDMQ
jgi:hypothetical protein